MNDRVRPFIVPLATLTAIALIVAWFPVRTLLGQSAELNSASQQLAALAAHSRELAAEQRAVQTPAAETLLARQEYQLVPPGERLIQVLTNSQGGSMATGDPGSQPLVSPNDVKDLIPVVPSAPSPTSPTGFWTRVTRTLEFWR